MNYEIKDIVNGNGFYVVFVAEGEESQNINSWFLDNIHVYEICPAPVQVEAKLTVPWNPKIEISWIAPHSIIGEWKGYNIFRSITDLEDNGWEQLNDTLLTESPYIDDNLNYNKRFCYCLTAVYDNCVSDTSEVACCDFIGEITESVNSGIIVFPNPVKDFVSVKSDNRFDNITLINSHGEILDQFNAKHQKSLIVMNPTVSKTCWRLTLTGALHAVRLLS